ncbi:Peptidoglycan/LPS O-acetylase OafA/YrhL, contains acyltransferase and SGNH-hydrolase domains [Dyadobacter koreensis]|uniref:Peptidoglycan/LPS O-acetylase OafA/YrhL, contains acyltransferase and SGNH-hydrolase domains n=1 Tax=Dyadobacter koreensis TaxID=408657 RepID=A0A1H7B3F0_9BACT|nr:acyltransferase [Dyadobacter koreensis]SEJ68932.1 Peptidoglycan/LPS O-acetylase OafA/YrhL, contains acyltransferase and SGNH-hydrolase domains [Dyadobacter koreensis]
MKKYGPVKSLEDKKAPRLLELDALRGLAALGVLLFHYSYNQPGIKPDAQFRAGAASVDLFFMISGFVTLFSTKYSMRPKDYLLNRFSRLFPTYWLCVGCTSVVMVFNEPARFDLLNSLANMSMLQTFMGVEDLDGSYWTLQIELLFYVWILSMCYLGIIKNIERAGLVTLVGIVLFHMMRHSYPGVYSFVQHKFSITNHFPLFLSGILFYQIHQKGYSFKYSFLLLMSLGAALYCHDKGGRTMYLLSFEQHALIIVTFHLIFALMLKGKLAFLKESWLISLGHISYSLYLLHQYIGLSIIRLLRSGTVIPVWLAILLASGCIVFLAYLVTVYVEVPILKLLRYRLRSPIRADLSPNNIKPEIGELL